MTDVFHIDSWIIESDIVVRLFAVRIEEELVDKSYYCMKAALCTRYENDIVVHI